MLRQIVNNHINKKKTKLNNELLNAISARNLNLVIKLIGKGANVNCYRVLEGWVKISMLHEAVARDSADIVAALLKAGALTDPGEYYNDSTFMIPLHNAVMMDNADVLNLLIRSKANVNAANDDGGTALHRAAVHNRPESAKILIAAQANLEARDDTGDTPLMTAAWMNSVNVIEVLLSAGAKIETIDNAGRTALHEAVRAGSVDTVKLLLANGADPFVKNSKGDNAFDIARLHGHKQLIEIFERPKQLVQAILAGDLEAVRTLISNGADVNVGFKSSGNNKVIISVLSLAVAVGNIHVVAELIASGAAINPRDANWLLPLVQASKRSVELVNLLLAHGAEINTKNWKGDTALHCAARYGQVKIIERLLAGKANIETRDAYGRTPLMNAVDGNQIDAINVLIANGASLEVKDNCDDTALTLAAFFGYAEAVELLIEKGADQTACDCDGDTALDLAREFGYRDVINILTNNFQYRLSKVNYSGEIPDELCCPISQEMMNDPIKVSSGQIYDRESLAKYFKSKDNPSEIACPLTRKIINVDELFIVTDEATRKSLESFVAGKEAAAANIKKSQSKPLLSLMWKAPASPAQTTDDDRCENTCTTISKYKL